MLSQIMRQVQAFERRHGIRPNVVYINSRYYDVLRKHYPELFRDDPIVELGFRLLVVSEDISLHPEVAWLPEKGARHHSVQGRANAA